MNDEISVQPAKFKGNPGSQMETFGSVTIIRLFWMLTYCAVTRNHMLCASQNVIELRKIRTNNLNLDIQREKAA